MQSSGQAITGKAVSSALTPSAPPWAPRAFKDYCQGNVLKYAWRWRFKNGTEDLKKARVYLDWLIEAASA